MFPMSALGKNLTIVTRRLVLPKPDCEPNKRKIGKTMALFDLLPPGVLQIINEMHVRLVHRGFFNIHAATHQQHNPITTL